jgi:hypothetical protein
MVWQQTEKDTFYINPVENAAVTISKGFMGNWKLSIDGHSSNVRVSRIQ